MPALPEGHHDQCALLTANICFASFERASTLLAPSSCSPAAAPLTFLCLLSWILTNRTSQVGHLPPAVARKLIAQQLAHTDPTTPGPSQRTQGDPEAAPERWQSNTTSESTAVGAGSSSQAAEGDATPKAVKQEQQQQQDSVVRKPLIFSSPLRQQQQMQQAGAEQQQQQQQRRQQEDSKAQAIQTALAAAAAAGAQSLSAPSPRAIAAAVAAASPRQPGAALTDDVIRMLLHKGLHALTEAQHRQHPGEQGSNYQQQDGGGLPQEPEQSLLDIFNTPVSTPGSGTGLANALQQLPSPQQQMTQQQRQQALMQQLGGSGGGASANGRALLNSLHALRDSQQAAGMGAGTSAAGMQQQQQQQYGGMGMGPAGAAGGPPGSNLPSLLPLAPGQGAGAAAGGVLNGDLGVALDGALENAMLRGMNPWGGASAAMQMSAGMAYSQPAGYAPSGDQMSLGGFQQQQQQGVGFGGRGMMAGSQGMEAGYGNGAGGDYAAMGGFAGAYGMQQQQQMGGGMGMPGMQGMQFAGGYAGDFEQGRGAAAAAAAAGGVDDGVGDKRKRTQNDPRVNCVKSVQYRVSRFPAELHDLCIEHWERARCARVVCNEIQVRHTGLKAEVLALCALHLSVSSVRCMPELCLRTAVRQQKARQFVTAAHLQAVRLMHSQPDMSSAVCSAVMTREAYSCHTLHLHPVAFSRV